MLVSDLWCSDTPVFVVLIAVPSTMAPSLPREGSGPLLDFTQCRPGPGDRSITCNPIVVSSKGKGHERWVTSTGTSGDLQVVACKHTHEHANMLPYSHSIHLHDPLTSLYDDDNHSEPPPGRRKSTV